MDGDGGKVDRDAGKMDGDGEKVDRCLKYELWHNKDGRYNDGS